jgi:hypothetical protein
MKGLDSTLDKIMLVIGVTLLVLLLMNIPQAPLQDKYQQAIYSEANAASAHTSRWSYLRPSKILSPQDVVQIQLKALQQNDHSDSGVITVFNFSSPVSKSSIGPIEHFRVLVRDPVYKPMLNFRSYKKGQMIFTGKMAYQLVVLTSQNNEKAAYLFMLARQNKGPYKDCWMTTGIVRLENYRPDSLV